MTNELRELKISDDWKILVMNVMLASVSGTREDLHTAKVNLFEAIAALQAELERKDRQIQELTLKLEAAGDLLKFQIDEHRNCRNIEAEFWENHYSDLWYSEMQGTKKTVEQHMTELEAELAKKLEER